MVRGEFKRSPISKTPVCHKLGMTELRGRKPYHPSLLTLQTRHTLSADSRLKRDEHFQTELVPLTAHQVRHARLRNA